jgi:mannose-6-phosphate isomerase-like protein (cupin superfamily)
MNDKKYFIGKIQDYEQKKGWFFGHFMEKDLLRSNLVEVAYQDVPNKKPSPEDWHYHKKGLEINIVISGSASFKINGKQVTAGKDEFWVVYPHTTIENFSTIKDTKLVVIKAPSVPADKFTEEDR